MSDRYKVISAMMDDPLNIACFYREAVKRRIDFMKLIMPPTVLPDASQSSSGFDQIRLVRVRDSILGGDECPLSVYHDGVGYYIQFVEEREESELGPFDTKEMVLEALDNLAENLGYTILKEVPWEPDNDL